MELRDQFTVGMEIKVRVHRVRTPHLHRWPLQLTVVDPAIQDQLLDPDQWYCPYNFGWLYEQVSF